MNSRRARLLVASEPFFARRDRLDESPSVSSVSFARGDLSVARYRRDRPGLGVTTPNPTSDMVMAVVSLRPRPGHAGWRNGRPFDVPEFGVGSLACLDLRDTWTLDLSSPFDSFHAFIPLSAFDEAAPGLGRPITEILSPSFRTVRRDEVMLRLAQALNPLLSRPNEVPMLFADHVFSAMVAYLASTYAANVSPRNDSARRGMLSFAQERRVKERLLDRLNADPGTEELAKLCNLSRSHFTRSFKQTTGMPPHRWLLAQRVARAKEMLAATTLSISEIALACGFADQSHLTRVFSGTCGVPPNEWRRRRRY